MAKVKMEVKHLGTIDARAIFATLEERSAHIKELEREIERLALQVEGGKRMQAQYEGWWQEAENKVTQRDKLIEDLGKKLALCDGTADRQRAEATMARNRVLEGQIGDLQESVAYLRGYIDHSLGHKPQLTDPDFREVERPLTSMRDLEEQIRRPGRL